MVKVGNWVIDNRMIFFAFLVIITFVNGYMMSMAMVSMDAPVNFTVIDKFCSNESFIYGCYVEDNQKFIFRNIHVSNDIYNQVEIGKSYSCKFWQADIKDIFDINPRHRSRMICEEIK